jgi:hypothetical protein
MLSDFKKLALKYFHPCSVKEVECCEVDDSMPAGPGRGSKRLKKN